jgi:hypothetical protein
VSNEVLAHLEELAGGLEPGERSVAMLLSLYRDAPSADIAIVDPGLADLLRQLARRRLPMLFTDRRVVVFEVDKQGQLVGLLAQIPSDAIRVTRIKPGRRFLKTSIVLRIATVDLRLMLAADEKENLDALARSQYASLHE